MVFGPRRAPQHLELAEARGEEGGRGGRRRTRRRGRRKRSCTFVRIQIPSPGRWGNRKFLSKDNKHIGRWPQLWNLNGILAAKREMLEHAKSKRTHRFNMFFNLLDKHVKHFFVFGRTGLPQYSCSYGGIGCKNCYYLYLCSGRNSRNFSQHTILFWHCLLQVQSGTGFGQLTKFPVVLFLSVYLVAGCLFQETVPQPATARDQGQNPDLLRKCHRKR